MVVFAWPMNKASNKRKYCMPIHLLLLEIHKRYSKSASNIWYSDICDIAFMNEFGD